MNGFAARAGRDARLHVTPPRSHPGHRPSVLRLLDGQPIVFTFGEHTITRPMG